MTRKDWLQLARIQLRLARALLYRDSLEDGFASFRDPIGKRMRALDHLLNAMQFRENARKDQELWRIQYMAEWPKLDPGDRT